MKLENRVALVTGAGKRIGRAVALELARAGANIVIHVHRSLEEAEATASEIEALGRHVAIVRADQRKVPEIQLACHEAEKELGAISILVNSAAIWPRVALDCVSEEDFNTAIEVNLRGPFFWSNCLGLKMKKSGGGVIVNLTDSTCGRPEPDSLPYYMAKAGVEEMTVGLARAFAPEVRVCAIGPGPVLFPEKYSDDAKDKDRAATLVQREGTPEDIAQAVRFLCENDYITGVSLPVDGGFRFGK